MSASRFHVEDARERAAYLRGREAGQREEREISRAQCELEYQRGLDDSLGGVGALFGLLAGALSGALVVGLMAWVL